MKTITFAAALAAATALTAPTFAAGSGDTAQTGATMQTESQAGASQSQSGAGTAATQDQAAGMSGDNLEQEEVRELQQALKDAGQDVEVDGVWGDNTAEALRKYQEEEGLTPSGELDDRTLTALGLDLGTGISEGGTQTQQAERPDAASGSAPSADEPMPQQKPDDASGGTMGGSSGGSSGGTTGGSTGGSAN